MKTIGEHAFEGCSRLSSVTLGKELQTIAYAAFCNCVQLKSITWNNALKTINDSAFEGCTRLEGITLPASVTNVGNCAFKNDVSLTSVSLGGAKKLGYNLFEGCDSLTSLTIPGTVTEVNGNYWENSPLAGSSITSVVVEEGIASIPAYLCAHASALTSVTLPEKEDTLDGYVMGEYAFYNCPFLNKVNIPQSITSINRYAFAKCSNLGTLRLPSTITNLDATVFENSAVEKLYIDKEDSSVALVLIDNEIPYVADNPGIKDSNTKYLDYSKSDYRATSSSVTTAGLVTLAVDYDFKAIRKNSVSELSLRIKLPSAVTITPNSVKMNGETLDYREDNGFLIISLSEKSGSVRFTVQPNDATYLLSYAQIKYRYNGFERTETINIVNMATKLLTLNVPNKISSRIINVNGVTTANSQVDIYLDDELFGSCTASAVGNYSLSIVLKKPAQGAIYKIQAKNESLSGSDNTVTDYVTYDLETIKLTRFDMYFRGNEYDLIELNGISPVISWASNNSYSFIFDFNNTKNIGVVQVVSTKGNEIKTIDAVYDTENDYFVATGFYNYVPGTITVRYKTNADLSGIDGAAVSKEDGYTIGDSDNINGYLTRIDLKEGNEIYYYEEYEDNADFELTDNLSQYIEDGVTYYVSICDEWFYRDNGIFLGKELYQRNPNGTFSVFRNGVGFFGESGDSGDAVGANNNSGKKSVKEKAKKVVVNQADKEVKKAFEENGLGDFYNKSKVLYDILSNDICKETEDVVYTCLDDILNNPKLDTSQLSAKEQWELSEAQTYLSLYKMTNTSKDVNNILNKYIDHSFALDDTVIVPGSKQLDAKFKKKLKESMKDAINKMDDAEKKISNQYLSYVISIITKNSWNSDSLFEKLANQAMENYDKTAVNFTARHSIDPSGYVYEGAKENRVSGVKATIYYKENENAEPVLWDAAEYDQQNPLYSNAEGDYAWDVPEGLWQVVFEKDGYETAKTEWLPVPPEQLEVNVGITSKSAPKIEAVNAYNEDIQIIFDQYVDVSTVNTSTVSISQKGKAIKGIIEAVDALPSASDSSVMLSNRFNLVLYDSISGKINCTIKNVKNYAGKEMTAPYFAEVDIVREISGLMAESSVAIPYKDTLNVTVKAVPAEAAIGKTMSVKAENAFLVSVPKSVSFNDAGEAVIPVESRLPGETEISYSVDGTTVGGSFKVVSEANQFADIINPDEPEDKQEPVVLGVRINPSVVSLVNSESCQLHAYVYGFYQPSQKVNWTVSGNQSEETTISEDGTLRIADNETAGKITITATSQEDSAKSVSITVDIYQIQIVSTVSSVTVTMEKGETRRLKAFVTGANNPNQNVVWSVGGNNSTKTIINENGELTIGKDESAEMIIVRATSVDEPEKYGEFAIDIDHSDEPELIIGDVNGDGKVTIDDATTVQKALAEMIILSDTQNIAADANGDGKLTIDDATTIQKYLAEIINHLGK